MNRLSPHTLALISAFLIAPFNAMAEEHKDEEGKQKARQTVEETTQKSRKALSDARERTPDEANQGIDKAMEKSMTGHDRATSTLERGRPSGSSTAPATGRTGGVDRGSRPDVSTGNPGGQSRR